MNTRRIELDGPHRSRLHQRRVRRQLLALGILSGWLSRFVNGFQLFLLVAMNTVGILYSGQIADPAGLVISNLPLAACAAALIIFGPGRWILPPLNK